MTTAALLRLAWRESRTARRRLALYMSSIALGVAALVAIDSFSLNVTRSVREQSRALLGGDLQLRARAELPPLADSLIDSLVGAGARVARLTEFASMALAAESGRTRLVQVRAAGAGYPFYGDVVTEPANAWREAHGDRALAFVDPALLVALGVARGDSIRIGRQYFTIAATLVTVPGDAGITAVIGPRVFLSARWLDAMGVLQVGSRAEYEAILALPPEDRTTARANTIARSLRRRLDPRLADRPGGEAEGGDAEERAASGIGDVDRLARVDTVAADSGGAVVTDDALARARVRVRTVQDTEEDFTDAIANLSDFLSLIGLIALLLGGIGVASGVHAYVVSKIDTVAVLRCLGASGRQVLAIYVLQAAVMGLVGAVAGTALGVAVQLVLPGVVRDFLPLDVVPRPEAQAILMGLGTGVWVALVFALRPLLALRRVSPLQAIRRETDARALPREWRDPLRLGVDVLLVGSIVGIAIARTSGVRDGVGASIAIAIAVAVLWVAATALVAIARRTVRPQWPFAIRQGVANLYRPANQTRAVTLALGFGAFLLATVALVQGNLLARFDALGADAAGNLLFFDVQDDQVDSVTALVAARGQPVIERTPIVTMRLAAINGVGVRALQRDTTANRAGWALRREYRSSYRDSLGDGERVVAGQWTDDRAEREARRGPDGPYEVSLEADVAADLAVGLGDTLAWDVQGVRVTTVVTSLRRVDWARFETNFFALFAPEAIERAPQQYVVIAAVPDPQTLALIQRDVVLRYANVSSLDLSLIRRTIGEIVQRVTLAVRFLGLFSLAIGVPVLFSAVAATRRARLREGVLLRTLGASRALVQRVLLTEYAALGVLGAATGLLLSFGGAWALMKWIFRAPFVPSWTAALAVVGVMVLLTVLIGLLTSRDVHRATPMAAIRES